jgi:hypothetical protein
MDDIIKNKKEISITTHSWQNSDYKSHLFDATFAYRFYTEKMKEYFEKAKTNNILSFAASANCGGEKAWTLSSSACMDTYGIENTLPASFDGLVQTIGGINLDNKLHYTNTFASQIDGYTDKVTDGSGMWWTKWFSPTTNVLDYVLPETGYSSLLSSQVSSCDTDSKTDCFERGITSGTSAATPVATSIAAVILSNCNDKSIMTSKEIIKIMDNGADPNVIIDRPESSGAAKDHPEYYIGKGKLKLDKALKYIYDNYPLCVNG